MSYKNIVFFILFFLFSPGLSAMAGERRIIKIGVRPSIPPRCYLSIVDGKTSLKGINIDIISHISRYMDQTDFEFIKCRDIEDMNNYLMKGIIDLVGFSIMPKKLNPDDQFQYIPVGLNINSRIFINRSVKGITSLANLKNRHVVTVGGTESQKLLSGLSQNNIYPVPSPLEALTMLESGLVDAFIAPSEEIARHLILQEGFSNIRSVGKILKTVSLAIGLKKEDSKLYNDVNEAVEKAIKSGALPHTIKKWNSIVYQQSFFETYRKRIFFALGGILLLLIAVLTWNQQLKKKVRQITMELSASERSCRNLIESSPDMIFVVDKNGDILHFNREGRSFLPITPVNNGILPKMEDLVSPNDKKALSRFLLQVFDQKKQAREFKFRDQMGNYREIDVAATLLPSQPGAVDRACLFARDITQKNQIERDLVQADRMAIIGQMAADVAHEINNPIGIVRANIDLILDRNWFTPEAKEFLESCQRNTIRAGEYTRDLLAISRPKTPEMRELNLWDLVNGTLSMMGAQLKKISIIKIHKGIPAVILGDWNLIQQVLVNLLLNAAAAVKAEHKPELEITCCVPEGSGTVRLWVEDKGIGIPKPLLHQVFEPFFTKGKKEGFGLGLFISKRIIENHQGIIYVESEVDKGTQFIIELPLKNTNGTK